MAADRIPCPACDGSGSGDSIMHIDRTNNRSETRYDVCGTCVGVGTVEPTRWEWVEAGDLHRVARVARRETLRRCAERYGVSAALLSRAERGLAELPELPEAVHEERDDG